MENLNIDLEDYKLNDLFDLAAWLHGEEFPTSCLTNKKKVVVDMIADQLSIERKEVIWMLEAREKKKNRTKMHEHERENAAMMANNKNWELLTREVSTLVGQNTEIINQNEVLIERMTKLDTRIQKLKEEAFKEVEKKL